MLWLAHQQLKSKSARVRRQAVEKLSVGMASAVVPVFSKILREDPDSSVREAAALGLADHPGKETLDALTAALTDAGEEVRLAAVEGLRKLGDSGAIPALEPLLKTSHAGLRARAAQALKLLGWQPKDVEQEALFLVALGEVDRAAILGRTATGALTEMLKDSAYQRRVVAANRLAEIGDPAAIGALQGALNDEDAVVRRAVASALGRLGATRAVAHLLLLTRDPEPNVRSAVVEALGLLGDPKALERIVAALEDPHWEVRSAALEALGRLRSFEVTEAMCGALRDPDREVREQACETLGALGDSNAAAPLVMAMMDSERVVRHAAARALQRVDPFWERLPAVEDILPAVQERAKDPDYGVQRAAVDVLRRCGAAAAGDMGHATVTRLERRRRTADGILRGLLTDADPAFRQAALQCLLETVERLPQEARKVLTEDPDSSVRLLARAAFGGVGRDGGPPA